jgi:GMP reductase
MEYQDIYLEPACNAVASRSHIDVSCEFLGKKFDLPVVPANMPCVINSHIARQCLALNVPYILSRYLPAFAGDQTLRDLTGSYEYQQNPFLSISIGLKTDVTEYQRFPVDWFTIDVAHGASKEMVEKAKQIKDLFPKSKIIAGNVGSYSGASFLAQYKEIDAIKVGIARGGACSTYGKTGFASPMVTLIRDLVSIKKPLIIDGGIKSNGDFTKAIAVFLSESYEQNYLDQGTTIPLVMAGSLFAACSDSAAKLSEDGKKIYYGNASKINKQVNAENITNIEGQLVRLDPNNMTFKEKIDEIRQDLQSGISYAGGRKLNDLYLAQVKIW